ncbi:MAG: 4Fe-4S dicluster domain-containing protein [Clostridiales bacterium]|nr:4Fe-4S dicluster domain-containing protein [Clostridiales bacterium]
MNYLGKNIPKLGFGLMRLPKKDGTIDIRLTCEMVDRFLEAGFTYFDTAYVYEGSEAAIKKALVDRHPRESYHLATKLAAWSGVKNTDDARKMFYTSLERTGAGYFDFYLLHNLGDDRTKLYDDYKLWDFVLELKEKGLVQHIGFSMHDTAAALDSILNAHPEAEFVQLQVNYSDWNHKEVQSRLCCEVAKKHNKPIIIMEPVRGGLLASPPKAIAELFRKVNPAASPASWALRFVASLDYDIITILSGMSNMEQLEENIAIFKDFRPLDAREMEAIRVAQEIFDNAKTIPCTDCRYCIKGCPEGIAIPGILEALNRYIVYENLPVAKGKYKRATKSGGVASKCIECGQCESACPQHIGIIDELKRAVEVFEN